MWGDGDFGLRDEEAAGHAEVNEELRRRPFVCDVSDDGFADAMDACDGRIGERFGDEGFGGFEGLRPAAGPDGGDALSADAGVDAIGYGFDFGELRHAGG